jgi:hypothetical protein
MKLTSFGVCVAFHEECGPTFDNCIIDTNPLYITIFRENSFKTTYDFLSPGSISLMQSGFNNRKSPLLNPLSLETQKKTRKVRPHSAPWIYDKKPKTIHHSSTPHDVSLGSPCMFGKFPLYNTMVVYCWQAVEQYSLVCFADFIPQFLITIYVILIRVTDSQGLINIIFTVIHFKNMNPKCQSGEKTKEVYNIKLPLDVKQYLKAILFCPFYIFKTFQNYENNPNPFTSISWT